MVDDKNFGWAIIWWMSSAICFLGALLFALFADSTPQKWAMANFVEELDNPKNERRAKRRVENEC